MQFNELVIAIVSVSATASVFKSYIAYKQRAVEARIEKQSAPDRALSSQLAELKQSVADLRDVTTQYDMSFDSALHRVESRLSHVEQRITSVEENSNTVVAGR